MSIAEQTLAADPNVEVCVILRLRGGYELSPIEARGCGVPSIVSRTGGLPEAAGEAALFCEAGNVASLVNQLEIAAGMSEEEYVRRAKLAKSSLSDYLPSETFYAEQFRALHS